ncbi:MAG: hypothetical protein H6638_11565 [Ardenticatenales bacterium]|nr:hypothetical protein [Ardenticatenales bacterium]
MAVKRPLTDPYDLLITQNAERRTQNAEAMGLALGWVGAEVAACFEVDVVTQNAEAMGLALGWVGAEIAACFEVDVVTQNAERNTNAEQADAALLLHA